MTWLRSRWRSPGPRQPRQWLPGAAILALGLTLAGFGLAPATGFSTPAMVSPDLVRFHVVAHSDRPGDQALKLAVRDALLPIIAAATAGSEDAAASLAALRGALPELEQQAATVVQFWDAPYAARAELAPVYFEQRVYGDMVVPAGTYQSLLVIIGAGAGHNWWCVLFPSLCAQVGTSRVEMAAKAPAVTPRQSESKAPAPAAKAVAAKGLTAVALAAPAARPSAIAAGTTAGGKVLLEHKASELPVVPGSAFLRWWRGLFGNNRSTPPGR